jgi:hypothetical protein
MHLLGGVGGIGRQHKVGRSTCRLSSTDGRVGSPAALWTSRAAAAAAHSGDALFSGASQRHGWFSHVAWCSVAIDDGSRAALGLGACAPSESDTTGFPAAIDSALSSLSCAHEHATPTIAAPPKRLDALLASEVDPALIRSHVLVAHVCASADQREGRHKSTLQYSAMMQITAQVGPDAGRGSRLGYTGSRCTHLHSYTPCRTKCVCAAPHAASMGARRTRGTHNSRRELA